MLTELYVSLTRKLAEPRPESPALRALADFAVFLVVAIDAALVQRAATRSVSESHSHWNALIIEAAIEAGAHTVNSEALQSGSSYRCVT